jgi:hypothetical protein
MNRDTQTASLFPGLPAYVGQKGQRMTRELRLLKVIDNTEAYHRYKYLLTDSQGNRFVWRTATYRPWSEGDERQVTFTVKSHSRRRRETVISNCRA